MTLIANVKNIITALTALIKLGQALEPRVVAVEHRLTTIESSTATSLNSQAGRIAKIERGHKPVSERFLALEHRIQLHEQRIQRLDATKANKRAKKATS